MEKLSYTPWGPTQEINEIAPGIVFYSTASHGGYLVSPERNKQIAEKYRLGKQFLGWYEEDCGWAPLAATWPELFPNVTSKQVNSMLPSWESWTRRSNER